MRDGKRVKNSSRKRLHWTTIPSATIWAREIQHTSSEAKAKLLEAPYSSEKLVRSGVMGASAVQSTTFQDQLTQEKAQMAAAQLLEVTNTIDNRVGGIADNVLVVGNRVAGIDET